MLNLRLLTDKRIPDASALDDSTSKEEHRADFSAVVELAAKVVAGEITMDMVPEVVDTNTRRRALRVLGIAKEFADFGVAAHPYITSSLLDGTLPDHYGTDFDAKQWHTDFTEWRERCEFMLLDRHGMSDWDASEFAAGQAIAINYWDLYQAVKLRDLMCHGSADNSTQQDN